MRNLLIGTVAALALLTGSAMAQGSGAGGGGGEQNTTVPRAGESNMSPGSAGTSGGNWSAGNPGGTTAGSGASGAYGSKSTATDPNAMPNSGNMDSRGDAAMPRQGKSTDTMKQGRSGSSSVDSTTTTDGSTTTKKKASRSPQSAQRATGTHCPPGTPDCRPGNQSGR